MNEPLYKIRRKSDGLFSAGGTTPRFTKIGKSWKLSPLLNHLTMLRQERYRKVSWAKKYPERKLKNATNVLANIPDIYVDCEVVTFEIVPTGTSEIANFKYRSGRTVGEVTKIEEDELLERCRTGSHSHSWRKDIRGD